MMPDGTKKVYSAAVEYLKKRFKPVDIEELKGMEFHQKVQSTETVEELGICLQKLCRKAFPSIGGKEFDRFLKGRFFQALLPKWQKKLGAPKSSDSFSDLYDRTRTLERHEKQFADSAAGRKKSTTTSSERSTRSSGNPAEKEDPGHSHANRKMTLLHGACGATSVGRMAILPVITPRKASLRHLAVQPGLRHL